MADNSVRMALILLIVAGALAFVFVPNFLGFAGGFTTLSLNQMQFQRGTALPGDVWQLTVALTGQGQYAQGTWTPADVQALTPDAKTTMKPLRIDVNLLQDKCVYPITKTRDFERAVLKVVQFNPLAGEVINEARCSLPANKPSGATRLLLYGKFAESYDFGGCLWAQDTGALGNIGTGTNQFNAEVKVNNGIETLSGNISNAGATSIKVGDNLYAQWVGGLTTGTDCGSGNEQGVTARFDGSSWKQFDSMLVSGYTSSVDDVDSCVGSYSSGGTSRARTQESYVFCTGKINEKADAVTANSKKITILGGDVPVAVGGESGGQINLELSKLLTFQTIAMQVNANFLGIVQEVGKPEIVSTTVTQEAGSGSFGNAQIIVKNAGAGSGAFEAVISCPSGFVQTASFVYPTPLTAGQTGVANIPFSASGSQGISKDCSVVVSDRGDPSVKAVGSITLKYNPEFVCNAGTKACIGSAVAVCTSNVWVNSEQCSLGCNSDTLSCNSGGVQQEATPAGGLSFGQLIIIGIVALIVVFIIIGYYRGKK